ncbi:DUF2254 domain-containing protein [Sphingobium sp. RSMS]|uniref:DUF2254 domain-containing protein n=1 Tax=Sphingobium sp. RSMS TaxID=520734 RepID=UPI0010F9CEBD|nr:DUF2254 domain-containing protein [Sphingobium sp. RSMS]UXC91458.1 DUF2254 domain-containing protein [Sphingobium sp. RSMS]
MKARLLRLADMLRQSYWFLPSIMACAAIVLAGGMIWLDSYEGSAWMDRLPWLRASRPSGARQLLSAIGGSMITVAGTVFSVTIAAVVYASGQYGPRLLSNFMRDRGNQVTLGTFIATFLYCLIVLRTVRSPEESGGVAFVPSIALLVAVLLALCSIAVLIFFIHHVPSKIHINNVIEDVGQRLMQEVGHRFPRFLGDPANHGCHDGEAALPPAFRQDGDAGAAADLRTVTADHTGYIQLIRDEDLLKLASRNDLVIRLRYQPGDFAHAGRALIVAFPAERCDEETCRAMADAFAIGSQRTALQDLRFLIDELVEIAARALSPGINDPFTAITCLDWLGATMSDLSGREIPSHLRQDSEGTLRVIAHPQDFADFLNRSFGALAQYCAGDGVAALSFLSSLGEVATACDDRDRLAVIGKYIGRLAELAGKKLDGYNSQAVINRANILREALERPGHKRRLRDDVSWLGGAA